MNGGCAENRAGPLLLERLQGLLQKQLDLVRQGRLTAAEALSEETDQCVRTMVEADLVRASGLETSRRRVEELYRELTLALTAQRAEVSAALGAVGRTRQMLRAYGMGRPST